MNKDENGHFDLSYIYVYHSKSDIHGIGVPIGWLCGVALINHKQAAISGGGAPVANQVGIIPGNVYTSNVEIISVVKIHQGD